MVLDLWQWVSQPSKKSLIQKRCNEYVGTISEELERIKTLRVGRILKFNRLAEVIDGAEQQLVAEFKITNKAANNALLKAIHDAGVRVALED